MNFKYMPGLNFKNGYYILIGIILLITITSICYFFLKKMVLNFKKSIANNTYNKG